MGDAMGKSRHEVDVVVAGGTRVGGGCATLAVAHRRHVILGPRRTVILHARGAAGEGVGVGAAPHHPDTNRGLRRLWAVLCRVVIGTRVRISLQPSSFPP